MNTNKEQLNILLHKITKDCDCHNGLGYCTLIVLLLSNHTDDDEFFTRTLIQLKCIEKYKYILSEKAGKEINWDEVAMSWIEIGYAKYFGEIYVPTVEFTDYDIDKLFNTLMSIRV